MAEEIERKFLVTGDGWRAAADEGRPIRQAYLSDGGRAAVRVRICDDEAFLTVKAAKGGMSRYEFEYPVPLGDAEAMASVCGGVCIEKVRYRVPHAGRTWEVDVYGGDNAGLVVAEIEIESEDAEIDLPDWVGDEVTDQQRYYASNLARRSIREWGAAERRGLRKGQ